MYPDGQMDLSQFNASWQILMNGLSRLSFPAWYLRRSSSVSAPLIYGKQNHPESEVQLSHPRYIVREGYDRNYTSEPSALRREVFFRLKRKAFTHLSDNNNYYRSIALHQPY